MLIGGWPGQPLPLSTETEGLVPPLKRRLSGGFLRTGAAITPQYAQCARNPDPA